jgi:hypothetical protein
MNSRYIPIYIILVVFLGNLISGCTTLGSEVKIGNILKSESQYANKEVTVTGNITRIFFECTEAHGPWLIITDDTGSILLYASCGGPPVHKGDHVRVVGQYQPATSGYCDYSGLYKCYPGSWAGIYGNYTILK